MVLLIYDVHELEFLDSTRSDICSYLGLSLEVSKHVMCSLFCHLGCLPLEVGGTATVRNAFCHAGCTRAFAGLIVYKNQFELVDGLNRVDAACFFSEKPFRSRCWFYI